MRGTLDVQEGLNKIESSGAEAVVMIGTYDPAPNSSSWPEKGFRPIFHTVSFVGAEELARRLENQQGSVVMSQVVPPPERRDASPLLTGPEDYVTLLKAISRKTSPTPSAWRASSTLGCWSKA